ncbi:MAG: MFS transporter [Acidimicrobiales bacterium]
MKFLLYGVLSNSLFQRGILVVYLGSIGLAPSQIGVLLAILYVATALFEVPTGLIADRFGRKLSVIVGQLIVAGALVAPTLLAGFWPFICIFVIIGLGRAMSSGADKSLFYDLLKLNNQESRYLRLLSGYQSAVAAASGLAILIGGLLAEISWDIVYWSSAVALVLSVYAIADLEELSDSRLGSIAKQGAKDYNDAESRAPRNRLVLRAQSYQL